MAPTTMAANPPNGPRDASEPGPQGPGRTLRINQRSITPAGRQTPLGDLPLNAVLSPDGRHLLVSNSGAGVQSLQVVDTANSQVVQTLTYTVPASVVVGLAYSADEARAYASGGGSNVVHLFDVDAPSGKLSPTGDLSPGPARDTPLGQAPWPLGLSLSPDGRTLFVADAGANEVAVVALDAEGEPEAVRARIPTAWYPTSVTASADGRSLFVTNARGTGAGSNDKPVSPDPTRKSPPVVDGVPGTTTATATACSTPTRAA